MPYMDDTIQIDGDEIIVPTPEMYGIGLSTKDQGKSTVVFVGFEIHSSKSRFTIGRGEKQNALDQLLATST